jgi:hypothetical protein
MSRYEDAPEHVRDLLDQVQTTWFPNLARAKFKVLFDLKGRKSKGHHILARIQATNEIMRHLSREEARSDLGFDYILYLDKAVWESVEDKDRIRILRHELRHCFYDLETLKTPYKLVGHDIEDFLSEVELNKDDPRWRERVAAVASSIYEKQREEQAAHRTGGPRLEE